MTKRVLFDICCLFKIMLKPCLCGEKHIRIFIKNKTTKGYGFTPSKNNHCISSKSDNLYS